MTTVITIPLDKIDERLANGDRWITGWGDYKSADGKTCLHGAIRYCQPIPGDAHIIEQVGDRYGFGIDANDEAGTWADVRAKVVPEITDEMLEVTFGPQWEPVVALVRRAATLTADEAKRLDAALVAAWDAASDAAWAAAWAASRDAARAAARVAASDAARVAARDAASDAARALVVRDVIGQHGFTVDHYRTLTGPWATVIGSAHPDDPVDGLVAS